MGLRGMRVRKIPLVRVLYAEATRPFPVNAKGAGPQTNGIVHWGIGMVSWVTQRKAAPTHKQYHIGSRQYIEGSTSDLRILFKLDPHNSLSDST